MSLPIRKLGLGGGGAKGILHIGALQELSKYQELVFPEGVYGSSIGSIIATYLAFGLPFENALPLMKKYLDYENIVPKPSFIQLAKALSTKGIYPMDLFEKTIVDMFSEAGLDITNKVLADAKMPLYIISSNITKGKPTIFSKNIPLLDALKCSCCIPGIFKPQELYGNLYVDGDMFTPAISRRVPHNENTLILSLSKKTYRTITPENVDKISPIDYIHDLYIMTQIQFYKSNITENTVVMQYPNLSSTSKLDDFNIDDVLKKAQLALRTFITERRSKEGTEGCHTRVS